MELMKVIEKCEERLKEAGIAYGDCYVTSVLEELLVNLKSTEEYMHACIFTLQGKEKLYTVKIKSNKENPDYLVYTGSTYAFYNSIYMKNRRHTKAELEKAGYGGVFDNPMFEVEEVS